MNRRHLLGSMLALPFAVSSLAGCVRSMPIDVGLHPWTGYEPLLLARDFGWLKDDVRLHEGKSGADSIAGLKSGNLVAACLTLDEVLSVMADGLPLSVVAVLDESLGADMVLARKEIGGVGALKGCRIAVESGAVGELVLQKLLSSVGLKRGDVNQVNSPPSEHLALWREGVIDAAISYHPHSKHLMREGAVRIFDSRSFPQTIFDVLAICGERFGFWEKDALRSLIAAHFKAVEHLTTNREDGMRRIGAKRGLSFEETEEGFLGIRLPRVEANRKLLSLGGGVMNAARMLNDLMVVGGMLPKMVDLSRLVDAEYLPKEN